MKPLILLAALGAGLSLASCEEPAGPDYETAPVPLEAELPPSAEDQGVPAADTGAPIDMPPADTPPPPSDQTPSEQTVQPESETLFY